jgi:large subunit ribosomal protein L15
VQLNKLKPNPKRVSSNKRIGRGPGSGFGKTSGKGHKGMKSRSGGRVRIGFEGGQMPLQNRIPKFGFVTQVSLVTAEVKLSELNKVAGDVLDLQALKDADILPGTVKRAKVILSGEIKRAVTLKGLGVTKGAQAAIEKAGGKVE